MAGLPSSLGTLEKNGVGLDPAIGFLHDLAESKEPLVCDLQELFRWLAACQ
ncbi:CRISPR-associated endonuclease Cas1 [Nitrososphaera viennensis]